MMQMPEQQAKKRVWLFLLLPLVPIIGASQVISVTPASNAWTVTAESAANYSYEVELIQRAYPVLRVEFPTSINDGYGYGYTNVELNDADGNALVLRVQAYDVAGEPGRRFFSLAGTQEWLACLRVNSSFHKPDPTRPFTSDSGSYWYVQIDVASFLGDVACASEND